MEGAADGGGVRREVLLVCVRYHVQSTLERFFELHEASRVWEQNTLVVREFSWKSIDRLCILSGINYLNDRDKIATIAQIASNEPFTGVKVVFVCQNSTKQRMITESR